METEGFSKTPKITGSYPARSMVRLVLAEPTMTSARPSGPVSTNFFPGKKLKKPKRCR